MIIRKAKIEDSKVIAAYMMLAMSDIFCQLIGENSFENATQVLECLISKKANQYSYENCWVVESKEGIIAAVSIYDGAKLQELRAPVVAMIKSMFNRDFLPEDESQAGEFYIDCLGVQPDRQGKGIGSKILQFLIDEYVHKRKEILGLLVDKENPYAKRLYLKLGFELIGEKTLAGKRMEHLQI
ncbi:MAG: GNAT family N-acetyltransferase [Bacteroidales bacterium]|nr:GNAT family N-acetyltransferase [Bacteroidales bacterium]MDD4217172.1 GNAT family N-acetyltransferase [Bacteroidales bacterium]MDY0142837.1 GNAT family N-acetyltransferase [Bacteroidales bacterium]